MNDVANNLVYKGMTLFWHLALLGLSFLLGNSFLIVIGLFLKWNASSLMIYLVGILLFFPNFLTLVEISCEVIVKRRSTNLMRRYAGLLKQNFRKGLTIGTIYLFLGGIQVININFLGNHGYSGFAPFFCVTLILTFLHLTWVALIQANLIISVSGSLRASLYMISRYPGKTLIMLLVILVMLVFGWQWPQFALLFSFSSFTLVLNMITKSSIQSLTATLSGKDLTKESRLRQQLM